MSRNRGPCLPIGNIKACFKLINHSISMLKYLKIIKHNDLTWNLKPRFNLWNPETICEIVQW